MRPKHLALVGAGVIGAVVVLSTAAFATAKEPGALVSQVREATRDFKDPASAVAAGYSSLGSCVSAPSEGAMGIHYANGGLIEDGVLDAAHPELLTYEQRGGRARLLGVEYLVVAEAWHLNNEAPPVLMGQQFHYVGSPNRYGLPAFYELHVWAWKDNPHGMFVDFNPAVSCEEFVPDANSEHATH